MTYRNQILKRFFLVMIGVVVATFALDVVLKALFDFELSAGGGILMVIVPAMVTGQYFFTLAGRLPEPHESWRYASFFVVMNMVVGLVIAAFVVGQDLAEAFAVLGVGYIAIGMFFLMGVYLVLARVFFAMGAKQQAKLK